MTRPPRVVSLVPSLTESLLSWGVTPVACTRFCEHPELPQVGGTKDPDLDAIEALHPDVVLCCDEENRREDYDALVARGVTCHSVRIDDLADVEPELLSMAAVLHSRSGWVHHAGPLALPDAWPSDGRRVFVPIWRRPTITLSGATYGASLLRHLGLTPLFADATVRYPEVTREEVVAARPDLVLLPTEPYPFAERHVPEWADVAPTAIVDGQDLFWWGTRTPAAIARLGAQLH